MPSQTTLKGAVAEADAIAYYTRLEYTVSIPFAASAYDMVIEQDGQFQRVQCKFTSRIRGYYYIVDFSTRCRSGRALRNKGFDILYCLCADGSRYIIPADCIGIARQLKLSGKYLVGPNPPEAEIPVLSRCKRCNRIYDGPFVVCDKCREQVAAHQRQYRAGKRPQTK